MTRWRTARRAAATVFVGLVAPGADARWVAKALQYPTTDPPLSGPAWPWALTLRPILLAAAAVAAVLGIGALLRGRRTAGSTSNRPSS